MGAVVIVLLRSILQFIAIILSIASGIILVRRLDPYSYALYQTIIKRVSSYIGGLTESFGIWIYRYSVQNIKGTFKALNILSIITAIAGFLISFSSALLLGTSFSIATMAGLAIATLLLRIPLRTSLDAIRPVKSALETVIERLIFSILIVALIYLLGLKVFGAFISATISFSIGYSLVFYWLYGRIKNDIDRKLAVLKEWLRGSHVPILGWISSLIYNLDVIVAYMFASSDVVAAFFATRLPPSIIQEIVGTGLGYLHGYVLSKKDPLTAINALRMLVFLSSPILAYIIVYPEHLIYLLNPAYEWASEAVRVIALASLLTIISGGVSQIVIGLISEEGTLASSKLLRLKLISLSISIAYFVAVSLGLYIATLKEYEIFYWSIAMLISTLITFIVFLTLLSKKIGVNVLLKGLMLPFIAYFIIGLVSALIFPPQTMPSRVFWNEVLIVAKSGLLALAFYTIVFITVDSFIRAEVKQGIKKLKHPEKLFSLTD